MEWAECAAAAASCQVILGLPPRVPPSCGEVLLKAILTLGQEEAVLKRLPLDPVSRRCRQGAVEDEFGPADDDDDDALPWAAQDDVGGGGNRRPLVQQLQLLLGCGVALLLLCSMVFDETGVAPLWWCSDTGPWRSKQACGVSVSQIWAERSAVGMFSTSSQPLPESTSMQW
jgi:hypothetical protein